MAEPEDAAEILAASPSYLVPSNAGLLGGSVHATSAAGAEVTLSDGRTVIDLGTEAASMLGHTHPEVVAAVTRQCETLPAAARGLADRPAPLLAKRLIALASPSPLQKVWFGANGADVVEAALKLARASTQRTGAVAVVGGYHGSTLGAASVSHADRYRRRLQPCRPGVAFLDPGVDAVDEQIWATKPAALIVELVQGRGHAAPLPTDLLVRWIDAAREVGAKVIVDEVQTSLWRCGYFSLALGLGLQPDAVLLGNALGGGVAPLSALLCTEELATPLEADPMLHSQSFSGHPLSCAAGLATLHALPSLFGANQQAIRAWLESLASQLARHRELIAEVRVFGLMMSLECHSARHADRLVTAAAEAGVLLAPCDIDRGVVRVLPPLVLDGRQLAVAAKVLDEVCARAAPPRPSPSEPA